MKKKPKPIKEDSLTQRIKKDLVVALRLMKSTDDKQNYLDEVISDAYAKAEKLGPYKAPPSRH